MWRAGTMQQRMFGAIVTAIFAALLVIAMTVGVAHDVSGAGRLGAAGDARVADAHALGR